MSATVKVPEGRTSAAPLILGYSLTVGFVSAATDQLGTWLKGTESIPRLPDVVIASSVLFCVAAVGGSLVLISGLVLGRVVTRKVCPDVLQSCATFLIVLAWIVGWTQRPRPEISLSGAIELLAVVLPSSAAGIAAFALARSENCPAAARHWISIGIARVPPALFAATLAIAGIVGRRGLEFNHPLLSSYAGVQVNPARWVAATLALATVGGVAAMLIRSRRAQFPLGRLLAALILIACGSAFAHRAIQGLTKEAPENAERRGGSEAVRPNVLLIVIDTLRQDFVSLPGLPGRVETPSIEALARDSVVFRNAVSQSPWTLPAMASILTGLSPEDHGLTTVTGRLPVKVETVAETLEKHGYSTAAIGHQTFVANPNYGFQRGFGFFDFHPKEYVGTPFPGGSNGAALLRRVALPTPLNAGGIAERVVEWLRGRQKQPFFLWVHYLDPHATYSPPADFVPKGIPADFLKNFVPGFKRTSVRLTSEEPSEDQVKWLMALYGGEVAFVDQSIGKILSFLRDSSAYDNTLIIVTSDHGEQFLEHGSTHHGSCLHAEELAVPLVVKLPHGRGREVAERVTTTGITPTILGVVGVAADAAAFSFPGLQEYWEDGVREPAKRPIQVGFKIYGEPESGLYFEHYKYIHSMRRGHELLFDLASDPGERFSVAASLPDVTERARALARAVGRERARRSAREPDGPIQVDEETRRRLRSIGYLGSSRD